MSLGRGLQIIGAKSFKGVVGLLPLLCHCLADTVSGFASPFILACATLSPVVVQIYGSLESVIGILVL